MFIDCLCMKTRSRWVVGGALTLKVLLHTFEEEPDHHPQSE